MTDSNNLFCLFFAFFHSCVMCIRFWPWGREGASLCAENLIASSSEKVTAAHLFCNRLLLSIHILYCNRLIIPKLLGIIPHFILQQKVEGQNWKYHSTFILQQDIDFDPHFILQQVFEYYSKTAGYRSTYYSILQQVFEYQNYWISFHILYCNRY